MRKLILAALLLIPTQTFALCDYLRVLTPQDQHTVNELFKTKVIIGTKPGNWGVYVNGWPVKHCQYKSSGQSCQINLKWIKPKWIEGPNGWEQWYSLQYFTSGGFCGENMNTGNPVPTKQGYQLHNHYQRIEVKVNRQ